MNQLKETLANLSISNLNEIQHAALNADADKDIILLAPTGSGKTLAFLLPVLKVLQPGVNGIQALVIVPSRELALQVEQVFKNMGTGFKVNCCYGGHDTKIEKNNFSQPPAVLIGTPGRIAYHIRHQSFDALPIKTLVLDEFDKALEFGFQVDMAYIVGHLKGLSRRILTSATQMDHIPPFTGVSHPTQFDFLNTSTSAAGLKLKAVVCKAEDKPDALLSLICMIGNKATLVFCNHREAVDRVSDMLYHMDVIHGVFHGGMEQDEREKALIKFRNGSTRLLITTDLASRGLDIPEIECIIHFQLPHTAEAFLHRNGRTARMHAAGTAYLLLEPGEQAGFLNQAIETETLAKNNTLPPPTIWETLYIAAGKKDKISKMDIAGLLHQKGKLAKEDIGLIEVLDHSSYVAVKRILITQALAVVKNEKIKKKKVKLEIAR